LRKEGKTISFVHAVKTSKADLRLLLDRARQVREEDRARLARDLHDDVCQKLTALSITLSLLQKRLGGDHVESAAVAEVLELTGHINRSVREVMNELRPKVLDSFGLIPALKFECQRLSCDGKRSVVLCLERDHVAMRPDVSREIFRLFQETLSYIARHAGAQGLRVCIEARQHQLILGIDVANRINVRENHALVWLNLQEWVHRLGGTLQAKRSERGTVFTLSIPIGNGKGSGRARAAKKPVRKIKARRARGSRRNG
jgi:two-component system, NarL family, sensor histidine kinase UhpB